MPTLDFQPDAPSDNSITFDFQPDEGKFDFQPDTQSPPSVTPETDKVLNQSREAMRPKVREGIQAGLADVAKSIPSMVTQIPGQLYQGAKVAFGSPQQQMEGTGEILGQAMAQGQQLAKDVQSPLGTRESTRGLVQLGMMALPALDLLPKGIPEVEIPIEKPPLQPESPPIQRVSPETGETFYQYPEGKEPKYASTIPSTTSVSQHEIRPPMGESPPLRQPGEIAGAQEPEPVPTGETVAPTAPETNAPQSITAELPTEGGPSIRAIEERPIEAPEPGTIRGWEEATAHGENWLDNGGDINKVVTDFRKTGKVNELEMGKMNAYLNRLQSATNQAGDALRVAPDNPQLQQSYQQAVGQEQTFTEAYKPMHTVASGSLSALQGHVPLTQEAAASYTGLSRRFQEFRGKPMEAADEVKADRIAKQAEKTNGQYNGANGEVYKQLDNEYGRIRTTRKGPPTFEDLGKTFGEPLKEVCET